ncbi:hypothetical protein M885DRAFT_569461 [Pelagophyceae sp. CCMP2097]|nr:hypothetical protein M885DRAFT_569461 [Pelagophyceae sp. CCMP2097]
MLSGALAYAACGGGASGRKTGLTSQTSVWADRLTQAAIDAAPEARLKMAKRRVQQPHQRKTGGTALRAQLAARASALGLGSWMPCFDGVDCGTYAPPAPLPARPSPSVLGGHLYWPGVKRAYKNGFDCLTIFREPVSRVASCWNFRFITVKGGLNQSKYKPFHDYAAPQIQAMLAGARSDWDEGCKGPASTIRRVDSLKVLKMPLLGNNEPLRVLSDFERWDEDVISSLTARAFPGSAACAPGTPARVDARAQHAHALDAHAQHAQDLRSLAAALNHSQQCFVGVFERCAETREALNFFQPWLAGVTDLGCSMPETETAAGADSANASGRRHEVVQKGEVAKKPLDASQQQEVERQNTLEVRLYRAANAMLDAQLKVARGARATASAGRG